MNSEVAGKNTGDKFNIAGTTPTNDGELYFRVEKSNGKELWWLEILNIAAKAA